MTYCFILISDEVDDFMREIQIDPEATFLDFHKAILTSCGYTDDQLTQFSICDSRWNKLTDITLMDMTTSPDEDSFIMESTRLNEFLTEEKQHVLFTYDLLADRSFFIELVEIISRKDTATPTVVRSQGNPPIQSMSVDDLLRAPTTKASTPLFEEEDLFGNEISDEDIDTEGLNISDGEPF
jgi:predicted metalloprotease with PDZ domain